MTTILVDMDGVLAWWEKRFIADIKRLHPHIPVFEFGVRTEQDAERIASLYRLPEVQEVLAAPGFYLNLEPVEGGREALEAMLAAGYDVAICTAPSLFNPTCASEKYAWVAQHLGPAWMERVIIARDKTRVLGDILIDDKAVVRGVREPTWTHVIFDQSYNRADQTRPRMRGWADWQRAIETTLAG